ncbi:DUF4249 domain-containing protein [Joostella atrarenae]|uniref:DUF4249 domain-containing protein n=1 Tax=Joostella atrarenae TaxID=679257 RepID=A0ABS9J5V3_9FLAO|nr:DUF4249 domain-containing protein [Joostella atrarenae]MCF8715784.1 DUF4249 domain-containing protein [Joostella atrarenae]
MKKILLIIILTSFISSCEEVIDVDLETAPPRLVVEASINWVKGTDGSLQEIRLTTTAPYFDTEVPPVNDAQVYIVDEEGNQYDFIENGDSGFYQTDNFKPELNRTYYLTIISEGETYTAEETLLPVSEIEYIEQSTTTFFSDEYIELKAYFQDPIDEENYYLYKFDAEKDNTISVIEDRLLNGNEISAYFTSEDIEPGDDVEINLYGISKRYFTYMQTLLSQTGENGGPFETQPATVRGNIVNESDLDNFAFGYFRLSETDNYTYTIE